MDKKLILLVLLFFLVFGAFSASLIVSKYPTLIRADTPLVLDINKCILLSSPKDPQIKTPCAVSTVARTADEVGIEGVEVCISSTAGNVTPACSLTDEDGIASFVITSDTPALAKITSTFNGESFPNLVTCNFIP